MFSRTVLPLLLSPLLALACRPPSGVPSAPTPVSTPAPQPEGPASVPTREVEQPDDLGELLARIVERNQVPGLGAAVIDRSGVVAIGVAGLRRVDQSEPLRVDDRFHLGSDTKAMTAYVVGRLVERGELSWDDPLGSIFADADEWMHEGFRPVTLDQLLAHRGGLPRDPGAAGARLQGTTTAQRAAVTRAALSEAPAQPAGEFVYSNLGYTVVGAALHERTGTAWEALMQRELFEPLGMTSCGFGPVATSDAPNGTWGHARPATEYKPVALDNPAFLGPAGTVHCTLEDWGRFAQAMFDDAGGLEAATRAHLRTPVQGGPKLYARGWLTSDAFPLGEPVITHDGSNTFHYASIVIAPRRGLALLTACNAGDEAGQTAAVQAMLRLMEHYGRPSTDEPAAAE